MKACLRASLIVFLLGALTTGYAQDLQKLDPALDKLVAPDAKLERVATGFNKWTEGPVWTHDGSLLFAEIPANNIIRWKPGEAAHDHQSRGGIRQDVACTQLGGATSAKRKSGRLALSRCRGQ